MPAMIVVLVGQMGRSSRKVKAMRCDWYSSAFYGYLRRCDWRTPVKLVEELIEKLDNSFSAVG
jgi:hypothetical protein